MLACYKVPCLKAIETAGYSVGTRRSIELGVTLPALRAAIESGTGAGVASRVSLGRRHL